MGTLLILPNFINKNCREWLIPKQSITRTSINSADFLSIAQRETPFGLNNYAFLADLPAESTLEGYLFPDTYRVPIDATASDLVNIMLQNFETRVDNNMQQQFSNQGLSIRDALIISSIVEREAIVDEERPLVASVFLNRWKLNIKFDADPTVQYAVGIKFDI